MANVLAPRVLKRGLELFALLSLLAFAGVLWYGRNDWRGSAGAVLSLEPLWLLAALALSSLDWVGGGLRLWLLARHVNPHARLGGAVLAAGLNSWGSYVTPTQTGGGPLMIYVMRRHGVSIPEAVTSGLMAWVATLVFFAVAGPLAIVFGAGASLRAHDIPLLSLSFYELFKLSAGGFVVVGFVMLGIMVFSGPARRLSHSVVGWLARHHGERFAHRVEAWREGIDRSHECLVAYFRGRGWLSLGVAVLLSTLVHGNKLLAGYVVLRAMGIHAGFVDVLVLQTTIAFLIYFAPTPGGSGAAEALSAALMSVYVPRGLLPVYTLLWRFITSYATVIAGSYAFYRLIRGRLSEAEMAAEEAEAAAAA